ncbi:MAG: TolC family protein [Planctomycetes bacterium]|nr:TolC family protein [Planctomycetota bacterium]
MCRDSSFLSERRRILFQVCRKWVIIIAGTCVVVGCVRYEEKPVNPQVIFDDWKNIDAQVATQAVHSALAGHTHNMSTYDLRDGISLAEAEITALFYNPSIRATRLKIGIPQAEAKYARLWDDPEFGVDGEYILKNVNDPLVIGAGLSITIPLSGRRGAAQKLAQQKVSEIEASVIGAEWALINELKQQWINAAGLQARERLLSSSLDTLQTLLTAAEGFKQAGVISIVEERLLRIQYKQTVANLQDVRNELQEHQQLIVATMGLYPNTLWDLKLQLPETPHVVADINKTSYVQQALRHPQMRISLAAYIVAERQLALEVRKQYPDLSIGFGAGVEEGESRLLFGLNLLPIPVWNANKSGIATATVDRQIAAVHVAQSLKDYVHQLFVTAQKGQSLQKKYEFFLKEIIPLSDQQLIDAKRLAALGQLDIILLADALELSRESNVKLLRYQVEVLRNAYKMHALQFAPWKRSTVNENVEDVISGTSGDGNVVDNNQDPMVNEWQEQKLEELNAMKEQEL